MRMQNLKVGTRLSGGFILVLLLMVVMGVSAWLFNRDNVKAVYEMINFHLLKERVVEEWIAQFDKTTVTSIAAIGAEKPAMPKTAPDSTLS